MPMDQSADAASDMPVDDRVLLSRIALGDHGALERLYRRYYPRLASFLWLSVGHRGGVEGVINDTFIEVWRGSNLPRNASLMVSTWIFGISYRKALAGR
jgi:RNA polymerase sigma-70 factor (ECF subfamily)